MDGWNATHAGMFSVGLNLRLYFTNHACADVGVQRHGEAGDLEYQEVPRHHGADAQNQGEVEAPTAADSPLRVHAHSRLLPPTPALTLTGVHHAQITLAGGGGGGGGGGGVAGNPRKEIGPVSMSFEIPMYNVSNLQVRYLRISEQHKSYNPYRWVRYVTQASSYVCRV